MSKYPKKVYPKKGDTSKSDTPINLPYPTKANPTPTGDSVNITKTVYPKGITITTGGVSKQKKK